MKANIQFLKINKIIERDFSNRELALKWLVHFKGSNYLGFLEDGTYACGIIDNENSIEVLNELFK